MPPQARWRGRVAPRRRGGEVQPRSPTDLILEAIPAAAAKFASGSSAKAPPFQVFWKALLASTSRSSLVLIPLARTVEAARLEEGGPGTNATHDGASSAIAAATARSEARREDGMVFDDLHVLVGVCA